MERKTKGKRVYTCKNSPNMFCFICGLFTSSKDSRIPTKEIRNAYVSYFKRECDQTPNWVPNVVCSSCRSGLTKWLKSQGHLGFGAPMIWKEPFDHLRECYFCVTNLNGASMDKRHSWNYANVPTVIKPIPHSDDLPIPKPPNVSSESESDQTIPQASTSSGSSFTLEVDHRPKLFSQADLNDLIRDLALNKRQAELLGSRFQERNLLQKGKRNKSLNYNNIFF